jgi:hypothetical protein
VRTGTRHTGVVEQARGLTAFAGRARVIIMAVSWWLLLLLLALGSVTAGPCPPEFLRQHNLQQAQCHVVAFAYTSSEYQQDPAVMEWRAGLRLYAAHTNELGGIRLRRNDADGEARGFVKIREQVLTDCHGSGPTRSCGKLLTQYGKFCKDDEVKALFLPFSANAQATDDVLNVLDEKCSWKAILAAGGADVMRSGRDSQPVWSVYSSGRGWAPEAVRYLHAHGARSFGVAGQLSEPNTRTVMEGIASAVEQLGDGAVVVPAGATEPSSIAEVAAEDPDVFVATGDDLFFGTALEYFDTNCYTPNGALFIEADGDGPNDWRDGYGGRKSHDGRGWLGTTPWTAGVPYGGPDAWPTNASDLFNMSEYHHLRNIIIRTGILN